MLELEERLQQEVGGQHGPEEQASMRGQAETIVVAVAAAAVEQAEEQTHIQKEQELLVGSAFDIDACTPWLPSLQQEQHDW